MDKKTGRWHFWQSHPFVTKIDRWRVQYANGYIADRRIFLLLMLVIISLTIYGFDRYDWNFEKRAYLACPGSAPCENPLFLKCEEWYCHLQQLPPGFAFGEKPDAFFENFPMYVTLLVFAAFVANHLIHNRKFELKMEE